MQVKINKKAIMKNREVPKSGLVVTASFKKYKMEHC